jgi:hypothetical protein
MASSKSDASLAAVLSSEGVCAAALQHDKVLERTPGGAATACACCALLQ